MAESSYASSGLKKYCRSTRYQVPSSRRNVQTRSLLASAAVGRFEQDGSQEDGCAGSIEMR